MQVTIRINKLEVSDIISTFQRYEYNVKYYFGEEMYENELRTNYDNLMNFLENLIVLFSPNSVCYFQYLIRFTFSP